MKAFEMRLPASLEEAIALLPTTEGDESAKILAGGQDLLTELKHHLVEPEQLVSLNSIPGLDRIEWASDGSLILGALVTLQDLYEDERVAGPRLSHQRPIHNRCDDSLVSTVEGRPVVLRRARGLPPP